MIILRTVRERDRADGGGYAQERRELERRLRARYPVYARATLAGGPGARYAVYDEYAAKPARDGVRETARQTAMACCQLSGIAETTRWIAARKLRAVLS